MSEHPSGPVSYTVGEDKIRMHLKVPGTDREVDADVPTYDVVDATTGQPSTIMHPEHALIAAINADIAQNGTSWTKCANCGQPYQLTEQWVSGTVCSEQCDREFAADIQDQLGLNTGRYDAHEDTSYDPGWY